MYKHNDLAYQIKYIQPTLSRLPIYSHTYSIHEYECNKLRVLKDAAYHLVK